MNKIGTKTIETERLILRRFRVEDAEDMYRNWASDPEVTAFLTWQPHESVECTRELLTAWEKEYEDGGCFQWALELKEIGQAIGSISVVKLNEKVNGAEIGYCMSRAYWGREIMPEALRAVLNFLFDEVGVDRAEARHDLRNPKSGRVMSKAGMIYEGTLRQAGRSNAGICDEVVYSMIRSDRK